MKVSMSWINEFVDINDITPHEYAEALTMSGSKVEGIECRGEEVKKVVVGKILSTKKHPDADKLQVCQVDVGENTIQIVTGATNIKVGDCVPVALHKSRLPGGVQITKGKLRGVESCGMMCSHQELGIAQENYPGACEHGILIILEDVAPGTDIKEVFGLNEHIVEFEITSNRPDCLSVIGLARETAITFDREFKYTPAKVKGSGGDINTLASVEVKNGELCPRYIARIVKNIKIGSSPKWMRERLQSCGIRSISNIVDITNYVLLEYGQPMHAFDLSFLKGSKIVVRNAGDGEKITTLDGVERTLDSSMLVIADGERAVAVAGVMGGENSEIKEDTTQILFESANFNGPNVRATSKKLGIRTEASSRYEKGLDPNLTFKAIERACELIEQLGAGEVVDGMIDVDSSTIERPKLPFCPGKINAFLGCEIEKDFMVKVLKDLEFEVGQDYCIPPSFRADIEREADIAEEIARIYGYDKIPSTLLRGDILPGEKNKVQKIEYKIKNILVGLGMYEIMTYSFTSPKIFDMLCIPQDSKLRDVITISNPLGEENSVMRTTTIASMLEVLARNYNYRAPMARMFEMGKVYIPVTKGKLPDEKEKITIGMYGEADFYTLKGVVEDLLDNLGVTNVSFDVLNNNSAFHPGRTASVCINGQEAGILGEIHPDVLDNYDLPVKAYVAQLDFASVIAGMKSKIQYKPLPKYPAVTRDIAIIVGDEVPAASIEKIIIDCSGDLLEDVKLFDVYKGAQIPQNKKSIAYALIFRSENKTLADEDINAVMEKIITQLSEVLNASLR